MGSPYINSINSRPYGIARNPELDCRSGQTTHWVTTALRTEVGSESHGLADG